MRPTGRAPRTLWLAAITLANGHRASLTILHAHVPIVPLVPEQYIESGS